MYVHAQVCRSVNTKKYRVLLDDGIVLPIVREPIDNPPEPKIEAEEISMVPAKDRRVRLANPVSLPTSSQSWISLVAPQVGNQILQLVHRIHQSSGIYFGNGVVRIEEGQPFNALMGNFTDKHVFLPEGMVIAHILSHPFAAIPSRLAVADVLAVDV